MKISLKTQNLTLIGLYIIFNVSIFLTIYNTGAIDIKSIKLYFAELRVEDGIFFSMLSLIIIIVGGMFSNKYKEIIVFWKLKDRLPGCEAFSKYIYEDDRIDIDKLKAVLGELPTEPKKQNSKWYDLFKSINDHSINKTHKDFLLCRELSVMTLLMFLLSIPIFYKYEAIGLYYLLFVGLEYIVIRNCAKNTAQRLVVNTLALVSSKK
jgi:hypothetical protein